MSELAIYHSLSLDKGSIGPNHVSDTPVTTSKWTGFVNTNRHIGTNRDRSVQQSGYN